LQARPGAQVTLRYEGKDLRVSAILYWDGVECGWAELGPGAEKECSVPPGVIRVECGLLGREAFEVRELTLGAGEHGSIVFGKEK